MKKIPLNKNTPQKLFLSTVLYSEYFVITVLIPLVRTLLHKRKLQTYMDIFQWDLSGFAIELMTSKCLANNVTT